MRFQEKITKTLRLSCLALVALLVLAAVPQAWAQPEIVKANVPFAFVVNGKTMSAGTYEFTVRPDEQIVKIQKNDGSPEALAMILTYVSFRPYSNQENDSHIVFDKVGNTYTLSEIWQPGFDGVVLAMTKGNHEHHVIRVKHSPVS